MNRQTHVRIARAALALGYIDFGAFADVMIDIGSRGGTIDDTDAKAIWLSPGRLNESQLRSVMTTLEGVDELPGSLQKTLLGVGGQGLNLGEQDTALQQDGWPETRGSRHSARRPVSTGHGSDIDPCPHRYRKLRGVGSGGFGEVYECVDAELGRRVAVKALRAELAEKPHAADMLKREARLTGSLEHPSIVPVYDAGENDELGPFYAMRLLEQPTLEKVLEQLSEDDPRAAAEYSLHRMLRYFIQICQAVDYAHSRGVIHCDLKPANILIGGFGEVLIVDWGMSFHLLEGTIYRGGTPGYMAPEQVMPGDGSVDARTDIFALGATLFELLCLKPAYPEADIRGIIRAAASGQMEFPKPARPRERAPERNIPEELEEICLKAMSLDRDGRFPSARDLAAAVEDFLEGTKERERRMARADELVEHGDQLAGSYQEHLETRPDRIEELNRIRSEIAAWEPPSRKKALWDAEDRLAATDSLGVRMLQAAVAAYEQALDEVPGHGSARRGLARLYFTELQRAQERRDEFNRVYFEELVRQYDDGEIAKLFHEGGSLRIEVRGERAHAQVYSYEERERRLIPVRPREIGEAPLEKVPLEPGSYLLELKGVQSGRAVRCPIFIRAARHQRVEIDYTVAATLEHDEVYVPGGPALLGGDEDSPYGEELLEVDVQPFVIQRHPVTFAQYLVFLSSVYRRDPERVERLMPANSYGAPYWRWDGDRFVPTKRWNTGSIDLAAMPAFGIDVRSAQAYAEWLSESGPHRYRLPTEAEWEKAARGTDGRKYPWGDYFDASFCKMRESRPGPLQPEPSGSFPVDESPYGAQDMAGGVAEWVTAVQSRLDAARARAQVVSRGGAWCDSRIDCTLIARRPYRLNHCSARVGFRLVRE